MQTYLCVVRASLGHSLLEKKVAQKRNMSVSSPEILKTLGWVFPSRYDSISSSSCYTEMGTFNGPIYHIFVPVYLKLNEKKKNTLFSHIPKSVLHLGRKKKEEKLSKIEKGES